MYVYDVRHVLSSRSECAMLCMTVMCVYVRVHVMYVCYVMYVRMCVFFQVCMYVCKLHVGMFC